MYIQRLYLYMNMTKPSEHLYLSYCKVNQEGKSIRPAYLVDTLRKLFPRLLIQKSELRGFEQQNIGKNPAASCIFGDIPIIHADKKQYLNFL